MVLLDFGQCKALSAERQAALARLVIAMDQGWPAGIVRAMKVTRSMYLPEGLPLLAGQSQGCCMTICFRTAY